ncbi:MAG: type II toxin-antitoxin system death-on-curing family toxin, partial [Chloroflexi bacterium]|nr:type II toxin-antitoxin system death-on-curing family toxin [Chloroflexota bacterium]
LFTDGNKRTGIESCRILLEINGYSMTIDDETIDVAVRIAKGETEFPIFLDWIRGKVS